uniref:DUF711 domain-containing protein n=1 Tax=Solibacter usitatus (strain Ellin6076) TaxID=234267 RepID=Q01SX8_SOLUE
MRKALVVLLAFSSFGIAQSKPKVRAITAFIRIDAQHYETQVGEAVTFLKAAREEYKASGFEVETIRVVTQPLANYTKGMKHDDAVALLRKYGELAAKLGFTANLGAVMLTDDDDRATVDIAIDVFASTKINGTLIVAAENGIHWKSIREAARLVKTVAAKSPHGEGNLNFATAAMVKPYTPFYPAAWHDGPGKTFAVGLESANVVADIFAQYHEPGPAESKLAEALTKYLLQAEAAAVRVAASSKWSYGGIDPTPAPLGEVSIGRAIENFIGAPFGSGGTMTAAAIITRAVQSTPVKQVGYAGLMVPVLEDAVLAKRWAEGTYNMDSLLAYSAVCAGGLDTIPLPGDISEERLARIMGDVASLAWKWHKPLAARLLPAPGKHPGDHTEFDDGRMANTLVR